mmetsp:Transcript_1268/g.1814  ORF Transcript_1268/g.1814 Transcript_1268/m.1814 type:complete len:248 (-) Transcript_1268:340-1083(-)
MSNTNTTCYLNANQFKKMLQRICCGVNERNFLIDDGFDTLQRLVNAYTYQPESFKSHLLALNKAFAGLTTTPVYFTPVVIRRLVRVLSYFDQAVKTLHEIPNIVDIMQIRSNELVDLYEEATLEKENNEDSSKIKFPKLEGSTNWRAFKDKLILKLSAMKGVCGIPLIYIVDSTACPNMNSCTPLILNDEVDIYDLTYIRSHATHYGPHYKQDNKKVLLMIQKVLIIHTMTLLPQPIGSTAQKPSPP